MNEYESFHFRENVLNEVANKVKSGLGIGKNNMQVTTWCPTNRPSSIEASRICSVISAYRLLDIVAMLDGVRAAPSVERRFINISSDTFQVSMNFYI